MMTETTRLQQSCPSEAEAMGVALSQAQPPDAPTPSPGETLSPPPRDPRCSGDRCPPPWEAAMSRPVSGQARGAEMWAGAGGWGGTPQSDKVGKKPSSRHRPALQESLRPAWSPSVATQGSLQGPGSSRRDEAVISHRTEDLDPPRWPCGQDSKGLAQPFKCSARGDPLRRHELCAGLTQGWPGQGSSWAAEGTRSSGPCGRAQQEPAPRWETAEQKGVYGPQRKEKLPCDPTHRPRELPAPHQSIMGP